MAGQSFVFRDDRNRRTHTQDVDHTTSLGGRVRRRAIKADGNAHDNHIEPILIAGEALDLAEQALHVTGRRHGERLERPGQGPGRVAQRQTDSPSPEINAERPHRLPFARRRAYQMVYAERRARRNRYSGQMILLALRRRSRFTAVGRTGIVTASVVAGAIGLGAKASVHAASQNGTPGSGAGAVSVAGAAGADTLRQQANDRLLALHAEADRLVNEARGLLGQLRTLEVARQIANEELRRAEAAAVEAGQALEDISRQVAQLEHTRDRERPRLAARFADLYKLGRGRYVRMFLSASNLRQVGQAARTVAAVAARDEARVRGYDARLAELAAARQAARAHQVTLDAKRADAVRAQAAAARAIAAQNALVRDIDERRDLNAQLVGEMQAAQRKLEATLTGVERAPMTALPIGPFRGALPWPSIGAPRRRAGNAPINRPGLEINGPEGAPVRSVHGGTVAYAGSFEGLGNLIIVDHGEQTFSLYGHLSELLVGRGAVVPAGQEIGRQGASDAGDPTLYFELRVNGKPVDPLPWLEPSR